MKKYLLGVLFVVVGSLTCVGQRLPFFTHHVLNPYIYNPAFAGYNQSAVFYLTHRQQWLGVEGAPVSTHLSFHTPAGNKNPISLGANLVHDRIGVLRHSTAKATLAYMVPLAVEKDHYLKFGLSGGVGLHQYDLSDADYSSDAVIERAAKNSTFLDARFGLHYHREHLNIGLALPHLLSPPVQNPDGFSNVALDQFSRAVASVNYRFALGETEELAVVPTVLYHFAPESASQLEVVGLLEFQRTFWVGGGYHQQMGFGGLAGLRRKNLQFSYAYATGGSKLATYASGTHEVQLGFTIGKKMVAVKRQPRLTSQTDADAIPEAKVKKRRRRKEEEVVPDRKKDPASPEPEKRFDDDSFQEVEQGIILIPSEDTPAQNVSDDGNTPPASGPTQETDQPTAPNPTPPSTENIGWEDDTTVPSTTVPSTTTPPAENVGQKEDTAVPGTDTPNSLATEELNNTWEGEGNVDPWADIENESTATPPASFDESAERAITKVKTVASDHPLEMPGGTYIIAGTFSQRPYADRLAQKLAQQGYGTQVGYNTAKGYYYVSLFSSDDMDDVKKRLYRVRNNPSFQKAWILVVE